MRVGSGGAWKPVPDYHPYIATGDFNGDGIRDFAVAVIDKSTRKFTVLVFNGPFDHPSVAPSFIDPNIDLQGRGFFYGSPRPKPYRLVVGRFEAEGALLQPHGKTYRYER